ncbi:MAG: CPBP family intramembrane metalloprotease [Bacteroidaceae bacterium]|nr:CPBP family intramembrane metalloprotease [Bacteroidaceae bacterium]
MQKYLKPIIALFTFYAFNWVVALLSQLALVFHNPQFITAILTGEYTDEHYSIMRSPEVIGSSRIVAAIIILIFLSRTNIINPKLYVRTKNIRWSYTIFGLVGFNLLFYAFEHILSLMPMFHEELEENGGATTYTYGIMLSIYLAIFSPIVEECIFRAGILGNLMKEGMSQWKAIIISAIIFGACHYSIERAIPTAVFAIITGWLYVKTRSLAPSTILHIINNCTSLLLYHLSANGTYDKVTSELGTTNLWIANIIIGIIAITGVTIYVRMTRNDKQSKTVSPTIEK